MRKTLLTILLATALTATGQKYVGGDISMLTKYEEAGVVYKDKDNKTVQPLTFFKEQGMNAMRVRLFVDPSRDSDKGVCQDLDYVKALGKRIKDQGMAFMLDFHYSDTWADPGQRTAVRQDLRIHQGLSQSVESCRCHSRLHPDGQRDQLWYAVGYGRHK